MFFQLAFVVFKGQRLALVAGLSRFDPLEIVFQALKAHHASCALNIRNVELSVRSYFDMI